MALLLGGDNVADDLMLEVTGSSQKAVTALDKVIVKVADLQAVFDKMSPSLKKFTTELASISESSKGIAALKGLTENTNRHAMSAKDAESRMAMYQARLDRATVSMEKSKVASEKLAAAQKKLREANGIDAANKNFFDNYKYKGFSNEPSKFNNPAAPDIGVPDIPTPPRGSSRLASELEDKVSSKTPSFNFDATKAMSSVDKMRAYIDSLNPAISRMSEAAQSEFNSLAAELIRISSQIDNQRALYSQLAQAATKAANATGEGSEQYLRLEKRMLSADGAIDKLVAKQEKLQDQMKGVSDYGSLEAYTNSMKRATKQTSQLGHESKKASSSALSGLQKTLNMMEKMFVRIIAFRIFSAVTKSITDGMHNIAQASAQANKSMSAISTSALYLKNSIAASFMPVLEALTPIITQIVDQIANAFNFLAGLFARIFGGATTVTVAKKANVDYAASLGKTAAAADAAKKSIMGFDEINTLQEPKSAKDPTPGIPDAKDMFAQKTIPASTLALADKIRDRLKALQPFFKGLKEVFSGFWDAIKNFAETHLYKWLCNIGDWMAAHPDTMYKLGKGLGYLAIGLAAIKAVRWLGEITGISKLVGWLWRLHKGTKDVTRAFDEKNISLDKQTSKTKIETRGLKNLVPWLLGAAAAAVGLGAAFGKVKMPSLNPGSDTANQPIPQPMPQPIPAPAFVPAIAPAIVLDTFLSSKLEYLKEIVAPAFISAFAPAIVLGDFMASKVDYLKEIVPPIIDQAVAPAIDLASRFQPSLETAKQNLSDFSTTTQAMFSTWGSNLSTNIGTTWDYIKAATAQKLSDSQTCVKTFAVSTSANVVSWGTNIMTNAGKTFDYVSSAAAAGLNTASSNIVKWANATSGNMASWGNNLVSNIGKTMSAWYSNFVSSLSAAWDQFTGFMEATGKTISGWWGANQSWAAPAAVACTAVGITAAVVLTGGAAAPAALALAPIGLATGGLVTAPTYSLVGEGKDNEAVIPLNDSVFSRIGKGIADNSISGGNSVDTNRIVEQIAELKDAIQNMTIVLRTSDAEIARSANRGNANINRRYNTTT